MMNAGKWLVSALLMFSWTPDLFAHCRADEFLVDEDEDNYYCRNKNESAVKDAQAVTSATRNGQIPPFEPLWDYYRYNRDVAKGLAPDENRCAIVLSMTLGLMPRAGEANLQQLGVAGLGKLFKQIRGKTVLPQVTGADIATRYYIRAQELAYRLQNEWGPPLVFNGADAKKAITGKTGIIFIQDAYPRAGSLGGRSGDHIDVWKSKKIASDASLPLDKAGKVWFWEIP